jgi:hypothetical protein
VLTAADLALGAAALAAYLATAPATPAWDALRYAAALAAGDLAPLSSGHHPLGTLLGAAVYRAAQALGRPLAAMTALQLVNAAGGAVAVTAAHALVRRACGPALLAVAVAVGCGATLAVWEAATDGEGYGVAAGALVVALAALPAAGPEWRRTYAPAGTGRYAAAGAAAGAAILAHQLNGIVLGLVIVALWLRPAPAPRASTPWRPWLAYATTATIVLAAGYAVAWRISGFAPNPRGFLDWLTFYVHRGFHFPPADRLEGALNGVARGTVAIPIYDWPVWLLLAMLASLLLAAWRSRLRSSAPLAAPLAIAAIAAGTLATWWEPGSQKFWIPALVCAWLAAGLRLAAAEQPRAAGVAAAAAALAMWNLAVGILPRHAAANPFPAVARQIAAATGPADLIIVGTDLRSPSLAYYGERRAATNLFAIGLRAAAKGEGTGTAAVRAHTPPRRARAAGLHHLRRAAHRRAPPPSSATSRRPSTSCCPTRRVARLRYRVFGEVRTMYEIR